MITKDEVLNAQKIWGETIVEIGKLKDNRDACEKATAEKIDTLYAFDKGPVLFKPTRAAEKQFRLTREAAISYFIGGNTDYPEDSGFALQPWSAVRFENADIVLDDHTALAMGNYFFTETGTGAVKKVEYSFGYMKASNGSLKITLHHSSVPFSPTM